MYIITRRGQHGALYISQLEGIMHDIVRFLEQTQIKLKNKIKEDEKSSVKFSSFLISRNETTLFLLGLKPVGASVMLAWFFKLGHLLHLLLSLVSYGINCVINYQLFMLN